jgi:hypothetical protein
LAGRTVVVETVTVKDTIEIAVADAVIVTAGGVTVVVEVEMTWLVTVATVVGTVVTVVVIVDVA